MTIENETKKSLQEKVYDDFREASANRNKYMLFSARKGDCSIADTGEEFVPIKSGKIIIKTAEGTKVLSIENGDLNDSEIELLMVIKPYKLISLAFCESEKSEKYLRFKPKGDSEVKIFDEVFGFIETDCFTYLFSFDSTLQKIAIFVICDENDEHKAIYNSMAKYFISPVQSSPVADNLEGGDLYDE